VRLSPVKAAWTIAAAPDVHKSTVSTDPTSSKERPRMTPILAALFAAGTLFATGLGAVAVALLAG
jgi:hypothetical protein